MYKITIERIDDDGTLDKLADGIMFDDLETVTITGMTKGCHDIPVDQPETLTLTAESVVAK